MVTIKQGTYTTNYYSTQESYIFLGNKFSFVKDEKTPPPLSNKKDI